MVRVSTCHRSTPLTKNRTSLRGRLCSCRPLRHSSSDRDLDYISVNPESNEIDEIAGRGSRLCRQYKLYFQRIGGIADFPECYEERLTELPLDLQKLVLKALEPYDLILSKLTRNSPKDSEDVKFLAKKLQLRFSTLYERWEKEMTFVPNAERHETTLRLWNNYFSE